MPTDKYTYYCTETLEKTSYSSICDENPSIEDVRDTFLKIRTNGDYLAFCADQIPRGRYLGGLLNDYRLTHFQSMQRLRKGQYLVVSGGDKKEPASHLFVVKMGSRKATGAWRSNIIRNRLSNQDTIVSMIKIDKKKWHAGGISVLGDILAVPIYNTGKKYPAIRSYKTGEKSTEVNSSIIFYVMCDFK